MTTLSPSLDPLEDLDEAVAAPPGFDLARLEPALATVEDHDLPRAGVDHRAVGNGDLRRFRRRCRSRPRHTCSAAGRRSGLAISIRTLRGAGLHVHLRIDQRDRARQRPARDHAASGLSLTCQTQRCRAPAPAHRRAPRASWRRRCGTGSSPAAIFMPSTTLRSSTIPSRGARQTMAEGTFRLRSISAMASTGTPRFSRRLRAPPVALRRPSLREFGDELRRRCRDLGREQGDERLALRHGLAGRHSLDLLDEGIDPRREHR